MTKAKITKSLSETLGVSYKEAAALLETVFEEVRRCLVVDKKAAVPPFGVFRIEQRNPRKGRNPRTGESVDIPAREKIVFVAGSSLRKSIECTSESLQDIMIA